MSDLYHALESTEYGQILQSQVRFESFKPEWLPNEQWIEMLGSDVDNFRHQDHMAGLTEWYIDESRRLGDELTPDEEHKLIVTSFCHDFAEAIDGDVPDNQKQHTAAVMQRERDSFIKVASTVTAEPENLANFVLPVIDGTDALADRWRAIEIIGYTETAFRANNVLYNLHEWSDYFGWSDVEKWEMDANLAKMYDEVIERSTDQLQEFRHMPVVSEYLRNLP